MTEFESTPERHKSKKHKKKYKHDRGTDRVSDNDTPESPKTDKNKKHKKKSKSCQDDDVIGEITQCRQKKRKLVEQFPEDDNNDIDESETPKLHKSKQHKKKNKNEKCTELVADTVESDTECRNKRKRRAREHSKSNDDNDIGESEVKSPKLKKKRLLSEQAQEYTPLCDTSLDISGNVHAATESDHSKCGTERKLTPAEIAAKEKKRQKMQEKKREKQDKVSGDTVDETQDKDGATKALEYLNLWKDQKNQWSFQKVRQVWLLQHMYDTNKVSESNFSTLLEYLEGLKGKGRELTVKEAEKIMTDEEKASEDQSPSDADVLEQKMDRAKQVLQLLS